MIIEVVGKEIEKIKGDFESYLNGLNMVGEISYSQYSELYDEGTKQIQKAYELGKSELEKENAELKGLKDIATLIRANNDTVITLMQLNNMLVSRSQQLTKAKSLLKQFLTHYENKTIYVENMSELLSDTEQFLSEVEK